MKEVGRTFSGGKEIGHLFCDGKEIRKMFYSGDLIYNISGFKKLLLPDNITGNSIMRIGEYIVLYGHYVDENRVPVVHRFKNGEYVDTLYGMSYRHQSFLPIYEQGFLGFFALDDYENRVFYVLTEDGFSNYTRLPRYCPYGGVWFKDRIVMANYSQYVVNSEWDDTLGIFDDEEKENYLHIPHCLMSIQVTNNTPSYSEYRSYCINIQTEVKKNQDTTDFVKDPAYNLDEPLIFSLCKDSGSDRLFGEIAFEFCWGYWDDTYWHMGKYEIEDIDFDHGVISIIRPINQIEWIKAQNYRGIPNCSSYVLGSHMKFGNYMIESDARDISGGLSTNVHAYFISDFDVYANYVLRRATQNDNGYRLDCAYTFDSSWIGYYNGYYYFINAKDNSMWTPEQYRTADMVNKESMGKPEFTMEEIGASFSVDVNAWNDDGIYLLTAVNILVSENNGIPVYKTVRYLYYYTE